MGELMTGVVDESGIFTPIDGVHMSVEDANELAWWRQEFSTRFVEGDMPKPGTPLLGYRFRIYFDDPDTGLRPWRREG